MNRLSKLKITTLIAITLGFCACQKEKAEGVVHSELGTLFQLGISEKAIVASVPNQLSIEAKYINDTRCSTCPDPGNVMVRIIISNLKDANAETSLNIGKCNGEIRTADSINVDLKGQTYRLILKNVSPQGKAGLVVKKLN